MFYIVYVSSAVNLFSEKDLTELLETSRRNNPKLGVTGMLLYKEGNFMQLIEGPEEGVRTLYATISDDARHRGLITLLEGKEKTREFQDWAMGFQSFHTDQLRENPGYTDIMSVPLTHEYFTKDPSNCLKLFWTLKKNL